MKRQESSSGGSARSVGTARYAIYVALTVATLGPIAWLVSISLKTRGEFGDNPFGLPQALTAENYVKILTNEQILMYLKNSIFVCIAAVTILLGTSILTAYALARVEFKAAGFLFFLFIMSDMVPMVVFVIPLFIVNYLLGLSASRWALILPYVAMQTGFAVYVLRGFLRSIPSDIEDAAQMDGCNTLQLIWSVMLPMIRPGVIVVAIVTFINFWNEYYLATILLPSQELFTLPAGLVVEFFGRYFTDWPGAAAGAIVSFLPTMLIFVFAQDSIIRGWARA